MKKTYINIPEGIEYLTKEIFSFPDGIFNKVVTGCGITTVALTNDEPIILVSPRKALLENKAEQHSNVYWLHSEEFSNLSNFYKYLKSIDIPKILITYDSFPRLKAIIDIKKFRVIVDEFHCLLSDTSLKSNVTYGLTKALEDCPHFTLISATPISEEVIKNSKFFNNLPYFEAKWPKLQKVQISSIHSNNPISILYKIIDIYIRTDGYLINTPNGIFKSKEAFFFLNDVNQIIKCIKKKDLHPSQVNILVSEQDKNVHNISKKLGKEFKIGKVPIKGEKNKMFTFCTSMAFNGVDFYSDTAITFAFSVASMNTTLLDVATDLQQIAGRQRLRKNPFHNSLYFIYKEKEFINLSISKINKIISTKTKISKEIIESKNILSKTALDSEIKLWNDNPRYDMRYFYVTDKGFEFNELIMLSELTGLKLMLCYMNDGLLTRMSEEENIEIKKATTYIVDNELKKYVNTTAVKNALRNVTKENFENALQKINIPNENRKLFLKAGFEKSKAVDFNSRLLKEEFSFKEIDENAIKLFLLEKFKCFGFIPNTEIKSLITEFYKEFGIIEKKFNANYVETLFPLEIKKTRQTINGKRVWGYILENK